MSNVHIANDMISCQVQLKGIVIIYPWNIWPISSNKVFNWNLILIVSIMIDVFTVPFEMSLYEKDYSTKGGVFLMSITSLIYVADVYINFQRSYYDSDGNEIINNFKLAWNYMNRYGLIIDVVSLVPMFYVSTQVWLPKSMKHMVIIFKMVKAQHIPRLLIEIYEVRLINRVYVFIGYIIAFLYVNHIFTCQMYYFIEQRWAYYKQNPTEIDPKLLWIPPTFRNLETDDKEPAEIFFNSSTFNKYSLIAYSVSFVIKGGEFGPITKIESILASIFQFVGMIVMAAVVGQIANMIEDVHNETRDYFNMVDRMEIKLDTINVSPGLKYKVLKYLKFTKDKNFVRNTEEFSDLAITLQRDMLFYMNQSTILKVPFFCSLDSCEIYEIMKRLKTWVYMPGDLIIHKNEMGTEMFFIMQGRVEVLIDYKKKTKSKRSQLQIKGQGENTTDQGFSVVLTDGSFFGELAQITNSKRTADIRALDFTVCDVLTKEDYMDLLDLFPSMKNKLKDGVNRMKNTKIDVILEVMKRVPLCEDLNLEEITLFVKNYVELMFIDPKTQITKPTKTFNAFYVLLIGQIKRYKVTRETIKYIKKLAASESSNTLPNPISFNQKISLSADEEREFYVNESKTLTRGDCFGGLPIGKTKLFKAFDVADSALQVAVLTKRAFAEMSIEEPDLWKKLTKTYTKYYANDDPMATTPFEGTTPMHSTYGANLSVFKNKPAPGFKNRLPKESHDKDTGNDFTKMTSGKIMQESNNSILPANQLNELGAYDQYTFHFGMKADEAPEENNSISMNMSSFTNLSNLSEDTLNQSKNNSSVSISDPKKNSLKKWKKSDTQQEEEEIQQKKQEEEEETQENLKLEINKLETLLNTVIDKISDSQKISVQRSTHDIENQFTVNKVIGSHAELDDALEADSEKHDNYESNHGFLDNMNKDFRNPIKKVDTCTSDDTTSHQSMDPYLKNLEGLPIRKSQFNIYLNDQNLTPSKDDESLYKNKTDRKSNSSQKSHDKSHYKDTVYSTNLDDYRSSDIDKILGTYIEVSPIKNSEEIKEYQKSEFEKKKPVEVDFNAFHRQTTNESQASSYSISSPCRISGLTSPIFHPVVDSKKNFKNDDPINPLEKIKGRINRGFSFDNLDYNQNTSGGQTGLFNISEEDSKATQHNTKMHSETLENSQVGISQNDTPSYNTSPDSLNEQKYVSIYHDNNKDYDRQKSILTFFDIKKTSSYSFVG